MTKLEQMLKEFKEKGVVSCKDMNLTIEFEKYLSLLGIPAEFHASDFIGNNIVYSFKEVKVLVLI